MKSTCDTCGKTVYIPPREKKKNEHYDGYDKLLASAHDAGVTAIGCTPNHPGPPARGIVVVALNDGTSSFARFLRERHPGMFTRPNLHKPPCYLVDVKDFRDAMNYAIVFRNVLEEGGIKVTVVSTPFDHAD